ncbi:MAG: hypothetical protein HY726_03675 [Candidatus Rokubacteria bacterium]|nr:hypothetical protein [Candidatus Rokubacteria bacterium]
MGASLAELVRHARELSAERDRLVEGIANRWAEAFWGQPLSPADREELWAALAEEAVRALLKERPRQWASEAVRQEASEIIARVRARVERLLSGAGDGEVGG